MEYAFSVILTAKLALEDLIVIVFLAILENFLLNNLNVVHYAQDHVFKIFFKVTVLIEPKLTAYQYWIINAKHACRLLNTIFYLH